MPHGDLNPMQPGATFSMNSSVGQFCEQLRRQLQILNEQEFIWTAEP